MYSAGGATVHCTGGSLELNGSANGGLINIDDLTAKINLLVADFNGHSHVGAGINNTTAAAFLAVDYENPEVEHG